MWNFWCLIFLAIGTCLGSPQGLESLIDSNEAQGRGASIGSLVNAGTILAQTPFDEENNENVIAEEKQHNSDLLISRIQSEVNVVVDNVWKELNDKRKFAILQAKGIPKAILQMFQLLQSDIFSVESQLGNFQSSLQALAVPQDQAEDWYKLESDFRLIVGKIQTHYDFLDGFMTNAETTNQLELEDYARSIIQPGSTQSTAMLATLDQLHDMAIPKAKNQTNGGIMQKVFEIFTHENVCNLKQSPQQYLLRLYTLIALTDIKGYMMVQFSYAVFKMYGHDSLTMEFDLTRTNHRKNVLYKISYAKEVLDQASKIYWICDSKRPREHFNYVRLTKLLQGHLENEVDMNSRGTCKDNCAAYQVAEPLGCYKDMFCAKQPACHGRLFDCQFFHADAWVCISGSQDRNYDWLEYENGIELGHKGHCINKVKVDSWWRFLLHCSYCMCLCDAPGPKSDRYWSFMPQESNLDQNKIVVGIRFVKRHRVIHLEIQQATALAEGNIDVDSKEWIEAQNLNVNNRTQQDLGMFKELSYEERALDLDRLEAPKGYVVTGVRFRNLGGHMNLEIRITPIRFTSGKLVKERTIWMGNDNTPATPNIRTKLEIPSPDVPTKQMKMSSILSNHNQYLLFDATSVYKDVSQTTIPYIDSQPVTSIDQGYYAPGWLAGVGIYYKGAIGYGGYVGAMVTTYDISRHLVPRKLNLRDGSNTIEAN